MRQYPYCAIVCLWFTSQIPLAQQCDCLIYDQHFSAADNKMCLHTEIASLCTVIILSFLCSIWVTWFLFPWLISITPPHLYQSCFYSQLYDSNIFCAVKQNNFLLTPFTWGVFWTSGALWPCWLSGLIWSSVQPGLVDIKHTGLEKHGGGGTDYSLKSTPQRV